jgi:hypothetical protein
MLLAVLLEQGVLEVVGPGSGGLDELGLHLA